MPSAPQQEAQLLVSDVSAPARSGEDALAALGGLVVSRAEDVLERTLARADSVGVVVEPLVLQSFERISRSSTLAVGRWMAGEGAEVARGAGQEMWLIFGELAAQRASSLDDVIRRCLWWRDAMAEVIASSAVTLATPQPTVADALKILQLSLEYSLVRMAERFEFERRRTDEELGRREEELAFLATHDALTGLPNRTLILDRVEQMLARSTRTNGPVAALFVDLDNFKAINDTLGHHVGDELLSSVAARLDGAIRGADTLGRLGGDEFIVISDDVSLTEAPELIAERLVEALRHPFHLGEEKQTRVTVTASIGIALGEKISAEDLLRNADIAMYAAKWDGKCRYAMFERGMQDRMQERMELEMDLREALERNEFFLLYQPTLDLATMQPNGLEALIRWRHPQRGLVQPDDFVPVLEDTGLICEVGRWVLMEACAQAARWRTAGYEIAIAVNVSGRQLDDDQVLDDIRNALSASELSPTALTIEITETALMRNVEETAGRLGALKDLGVRIAIDDFGTGYSSLSHLSRFPVDALKIDRSFVSSLENNEEGETLIRTLVQLGKTLSIETFAEGIERQRELLLLKDEHCDSGQGFLFARPLDLDGVQAFLERSQSADD
ncbi:MAG TPA: EAL domain-containing protein [Solirubrobacteraceae bacterium]|jgi:diguanylate cyclase (GGDEF)-like protein|nr:EAL domain-containing protein [Solirubrobacteraceae bacterium]